MIAPIPRLAPIPARSHAGCWLRPLWGLLGLGFSLSCSVATASTTLPPSVLAALERAKIPASAVAVLVTSAQGNAQVPRLAWRTQEAMNPASVMKLVTTYAALDQLGPAATWRTPVYLQGPVRNGTLHGTLYLQGLGDPTLVVERLWLLLRRVQAQGIQAIEGDIVLDASAFEVPAHDPSAFDAQPLRPYNVAPSALLLNFQALSMTFVPDPSTGRASISYEPPLAGIRLPSSVPLASGGCGDWRQHLQADLSQPAQITFSGHYPSACGERTWPVSPLPAPVFNARAIQGMWQALGGRVSGQVRSSTVPAGLAPAFEFVSPPLAQVVRDINKYSNNVMAQQVFLTLGLRQAGAGSFEAARGVVQRWWQQRWPDVAPPVLDNGAGLSREERISAAALGQMLQTAWASPVMPELLASLPIVGIDGTLRRQHQNSAAGTAHLKSGSLRDVMALAGYVHAAQGHRYVVVALVNHPQASAARPVLDALLDWVVQGPP